jgi:hypothetical protein
MFANRWLTPANRWAFFRLSSDGKWRIGVNDPRDQQFIKSRGLDSPWETLRQAREMLELTLDAS